MQRHENYALNFKFILLIAEQCLFFNWHFLSAPSAVPISFPVKLHVHVAWPKPHRGQLPLLVLWGRQSPQLRWPEGKCASLQQHSQQSRAMPQPSSPNKPSEPHPATSTEGAGSAWGAEKEEGAASKNLEAKKGKKLRKKDDFFFF